MEHEPFIANRPIRLPGELLDIEYVEPALNEDDQVSYDQESAAIIDSRAIAPEDIGTLLTEQTKVAPDSLGSLS